MDNLNIDTSLVTRTADSIEAEKEKLGRAFDRSVTWMQNLNGKWTGQGGPAMVSAYSAFANKYFEKTINDLEQYVLFLRGAAGLYEKTEAEVAKKADEI